MPNLGTDLEVLTFPADVLPEAWLLRYDQPVVLPRFPESSQMALVIVVAEDMTTDSEASTVYLVKTVEQIQQIHEKHTDLRSARLCFTVPLKPLSPFRTGNNALLN